MNIDIQKKIEELRLVDEAQQHEQLEVEDYRRRWQLLKHPFVQKVRDLLMRKTWLQTEQLRKRLYKSLDTKKAATFTDIQKKIQYQLEAEGDAVTEEQLSKILREVLKAEEFMM